MMLRLMKYAFINMTEREARFNELSVENLGCPGALADKLGYIWDFDPEAVLLTTGVLTGTGVPGSGGMNWLYMKQDGVKVIASEGRLGAMLRHAGLDALVFVGACTGKIALSIDEGGVSFTDAGTMKYEDILLARQDSAAAVAMIEETVSEDKCFAISDAETARLLAGKGLHSITAYGVKTIKVADCKGFLSELTNTQKLDPAAKLDCEHPARYLSSVHCADIAADNTAAERELEHDEALYVSLGLIPDSRKEPDRVSVQRFVSACTGEVFGTEQMDALSKCLFERHLSFREVL